MGNHISVDYSLFTARLGIGKGDIIALIGSGGKTSIMYQLARALVEDGRRVITTTTTHILIPHGEPWLLMKEKEKNCRNFWEEKKNHLNHLTLGWEREGGKLTGLPPEAFRHLEEWKSLDAVLAECDGSRGRSLKGYMSHEPVIPGNARWCIIVLGMDILGRSLDNRHVHRPEIVQLITSLKEGAPVEIQHIEAMLTARNGYLEKAGDTEKMLILNKISTDDEYRGARYLKEKISSHLPGMPVVLRGIRGGTDRGFYSLMEI